MKNSSWKSLLVLIAGYPWVYNKEFTKVLGIEEKVNLKWGTATANQFFSETIVLGGIHESLNSHVLHPWEKHRSLNVLPWLISLTLPPFDN